MHGKVHGWYQGERYGYEEPLATADCCVSSLARLYTMENMKRTKSRRPIEQSAA